LGYDRNAFFGEEFATIDIKSNATAEVQQNEKDAFRRCFQKWQDR
jgi:hypothetical protein